MTDHIISTIADALSYPLPHESHHFDRAERILAALKAARIAVVELPEPAMHSGAGDPVWQTLVGSEPEDVFFEGDEVLISGVCQLFADEVRPLAASLLAAELFAAEASQ